MFSRRLAAIVAGAALGTTQGTASFASEEVAGETTTPVRIRVAVAIERDQRLVFPPEFGEQPGTIALAQGVREACVPSASSGPTPPPSPCAEIGDAAGSRVCVDETLARALSREIECGPADASAEALDLSGSACQTSECLRAEARRVGASHLLLVGGTWQDGFTVEGTLTSLQDPQVTRVGPGPSYNPQRPRTGPQVLAILKWVARDAVVSELRRLRDRRVVDLAAARAAPVASAVTPAIVVMPSKSAPEPSSHRALGWTLLAAGVASGGASAWFFAVDKANTGCTPIAGDTDPCARVRRTVIPAIGLGIGAGAALVSGTLLLLSDRPSGAVAISARPDGVAIGGTF